MLVGTLALITVSAAYGEFNQQKTHKEIGMSPPLTLWQVIDRLVEQIPFTQAKVEAALDVSLTGKKGSGTLIIYESAPKQLDDEVMIEKVELRLNREPHTAGFVILHVAGVCVSLAQVHMHYADLHVIQVPYGHSLYERTVYRTSLPWGNLNFGFTQTKPDCLASVTFQPGE